MLRCPEHLDGVPNQQQQQKTIRWRKKWKDRNEERTRKRFTGRQGLLAGTVSMRYPPCGVLQAPPWGLFPFPFLAPLVVLCLFLLTDRLRLA